MDAKLCAVAYSMLMGFALAMNNAIIVPGGIANWLMTDS
jgi:hypothetical protein